MKAASEGREEDMAKSSTRNKANDADEAVATEEHASNRGEEEHGVMKEGARGDHNDEQDHEDRKQNAKVLPDHDTHTKQHEKRRNFLDPRTFDYLLYRFAQEPIKVKVLDVKIEGNKRTKDSVIDAQLQKVKRAQTTQELLQEAAQANINLESMGIFEKCIISLEAGPVELPGTANVFVNVVELSRPYSGDLGIFSKPETRSWTLEGSVKWKNILGYGETWDGTGSYGWDGVSEMSAGLHYPRFHGLPAALVTRAFICTQDWQRYSSYKERLVGVSLGLLAHKYHDLSYNLTWRTLEDPEHIASRLVRRQLGHSLLSSVKYTFNIDKRDSAMRPKSGYAFRSATQVTGIGPDSKLLRFIRQELDLRLSIPLGFYNTALNLGVSGGLIVPWGEGFRKRTTTISDRFFMGGNSSLVCDMNGPGTLLGFRSRGVGPTDIRPEKDALESTELRDNLGGDIALTGFADLSFDLPLKFLRDQNIHGHCFVCAGNLMGLNEFDRQSFSLQKLWSSLRCSAGAGIVIPTKILRLEVNFCHILRQFNNDHGKRGVQFCFSAPR